MRNGYRISLALCVGAALSATGAYADKIDINAEIVKRLQKAGKLNAIYKGKTGKDLPANLSVAAIFEGEIGGRGLKISVPGRLVGTPSVLDEFVASNCFSETLSEEIDLQGDTTTTDNFQNTDQVESGMEFTVSVGYDSPWGGHASASTTAKQSTVKIQSKGGSTEQKSHWGHKLTLPVPAQRAVTVQLTVTEMKLDNVPYTANFIVAGRTRLVFSPGAAGYNWVERRGSALPASPIKVGTQSNGAPLYVCRVKNDSGTMLGKTHGDVCYLGLSGPGIVGMMPGLNSNAYEVLTGPQAALATGDQYTGTPFNADGKGLQLCLAKTGWGPLPGYVKDGVCYSQYDQRTRATRDYQVVLDPTSGGVEVAVNDIKDQLPNEADRTFDLRGQFSGVAAVSGTVNASSPRAASDCNPIVNASASSVQASGMSAPGIKAARAAPMKVDVKHTRPGAPLQGAQVVQAITPK